MNLHLSETTCAHVCPCTHTCTEILSVWKSIKATEAQKLRANLGCKSFRNTTERKRIPCRTHTKKSKTKKPQTTSTKANPKKQRRRKLPLGFSSRITSCPQFSLQNIPWVPLSLVLFPALMASGGAANPAPLGQEPRQHPAAASLFAKVLIFKVPSSRV